MARPITHGHCSKVLYPGPGMGSSTYKAWRGMFNRCYDKRHARYPMYGERGIRMSKRWYHSFEEFLKDMGERPEGKTLDRINNDKGYSKKNCRWATPREQAKNRQRTIFAKHKGKILSLAEWSRLLAIPKSTLDTRYRKGERDDELLRPARAYRNGCVAR